MAVSKKAPRVSIADRLSDIESSGIQEKKTTVPEVQEMEDDSDITVVGIRLHKKERNEIKSFFAAYGLTVSAGLRLSLAYFEEKARKGDIKITKSGVVELSRN